MPASLYTLNALGAEQILDYAIERLCRDVRLFHIYEGTTQIQQVVIASNTIREAHT